MRGDIHEVTARRGARGHEQQGRRYAVVVQSDDLMLSTMLVAPTSTSARPTSFRPTIELLGRPTQVLVEQTMVMDEQRLGPWVGRLTLEEQRDVEGALRLALALD